MRTYSGIALHAPKEQLLTCVDKEIMGNILRLSRDKERDLQLKLALVQSITEVSCAIQAVGDCGSFELSLKQEAMRTLLDWIKREPWDSLVYGVFQALEELSKLRPPLSGKENGNLLAVCCQSVLSHPSEEQMKKGRKSVRAAVNMELLHRRGMEDLGHLIETLLEAEATSACFCKVFHVLKGWLTSAKEWERERALRVCTHVLGACKERCELTVSRDPPRALVPHSHHSWPWKGALPSWVLAFGAPGIMGQPFCLVAAQGAGWAVEASGRWDCLQRFSCCCPLQRGCPYKQFGSLVGLLGSLTSDCLDTCHQRAWVCLGYLLQMQAKSMKVPQADEIRCLCEELNSPDTETFAETCTQITKAVCRCIPAAQAVDFLTAILDSLLHVMPPRARAVRKWVFIFLVECREEIVQEVPKILNTLYSYMQQSTHRPFLLRAVFLLTRFHQEPVISSLLQKSLLMDSDTVELWRSLGRSILGIQILRCLVEKLNRAGNDRLGTDSSPCEQHSCQTALETLTITRAISEVVFALRSTEELRRLLPHLLPSLLRWASEMLGGERQLLLMTSWKQLHVEKPCRIFLSAIKLVLGKCMAQKWTQLLEIWGVWARLEVPVAHPEGVRLLTR
ncbi:maestro heat-like repeat-containing protein family member 2B [Buteo buteo]|uniref:maestro heat-like repeat-containing protein family member 2B n=1 Tax=Buteo buteo TaxID=30397 RepID=UPI003EBA5A76